MATSSVMAALALPAPVLHERSAVLTNGQLPKPILSHKIQIGAHLAPGSLQANVRSLAKQFGWNQVIWNVPNDYEWVGDVTISAPTFKEILAKVLTNYPLQAIFYHGNHVLVISPRTLINEED
jgi:hypothetical protein